MNYSMTYRCLCKCRLSALADEAFKEELENLEENPKQVKRPELPILYYLYPLKLILYRKVHHSQERSTSQNRSQKEKEESEPDVQGELEKTEEFDRDCILLETSVDL